MANGWRMMGAVIMMISVKAGATPIDGYTQEAYDQNKTLLKSVIKMESGMFFSKSTCSATLISKNILLTAKHCVDGFFPGKKITLNENPQYEVVSVEQSSAMAAFMKATMMSNAAVEEISTDLALVLFKSTDCTRSTLTGIQPISFAKASMKGRLSNRVLIAGYGITAPDRIDSGALHAGYNEWVVSDYSEVDPQISSIFKAIAKHQQVPESSLIMASERSDIYGFINKKGEKISSKITPIESEVLKEGALPLPGDSGGPAIAFDESGNPFIVGVTSLASPNIGKADTMVMAMEQGAAKPFFAANVSATTPAQEKEDLLDKAMSDLWTVLEEENYVNAQQMVLKDFAVFRVSGRGAIGTYASVLNPVNDSFLNSSLEILQKVRDAANYCQ